MNKIDISVVIPVWNTGALLGETVKSVLAQSYESFELILVDDGSTDAETLGLLTGFDDKRIRVLHRQNGGVAEARNTGISAAKGKYVALLDHDDIWHSGKLAAQKKQLDENSDAVLVYSGIAPFGVSESITIPDYKFVGENAFLSELEQNKIHSTSCIMFRRSVVEAHGIMFRKECVPCDDWDFYLQISRYGRFVFTADVPVRYRLHEKNQSADVAKMYKAGLRVLDKVCSEYDMAGGSAGVSRKKVSRIIKRHRAKHFRGLAYLAYNKKEYLPAAEYAMQELNCRISLKALAVLCAAKLKSLLSEQ